MNESHTKRVKAECIRHGQTYDATEEAALWEKEKQSLRDLVKLEKLRA